MNIILIENRIVVAVFASWQDSQAYLAERPPNIRGFLHLNTDASFPFYLVQDEQGGIQIIQNECDLPDSSGIAYLIRQDYVSAVPWTDCMGELEHFHL